MTPADIAHLLAPFEGCDHSAPERVQAVWDAQLCPICATQNWRALLSELEALRRVAEAAKAFHDAANEFAHVSCDPSATLAQNDAAWKAKEETWDVLGDVLSSLTALGVKDDEG